MSQTDRDTFRHVIGHFASGVTVLTTQHGGEDFGATASAVSSLSLDPPMLLVCLNTRGSTQQAIHGSRAFGVNILDEDQGIVAERFGHRVLDAVPGADQLDRLLHSHGAVIARRSLPATARVTLARNTRCVPATTSSATLHSQ